MKPRFAVSGGACRDSHRGGHAQEAAVADPETTTSAEPDALLPSDQSHKSSVFRLDVVQLRGAQSGAWTSQQERAT